MTSRWLILVVALSALAACNRDPQGKNSPATASTSGPGDSEAALTNPKAIADGEYTVCDVKGTPVHDDPSGVRFGGNHLNTGDVVRISTVAGERQVEFVHSSAASQTQGLLEKETFTVQADAGGGLSTEVPLDHVVGGGHKPSKHSVSIFHASGEVPSCEGENALLGIRMCAPFVDATGVAGWQCGSTLPHLGDVHVEN